ncbi:helix-turn-helix domain-containing protein [Xenophilus arseniciresistens]|uniref:Helix-turn-helix domain-containing protein n=1 Tax=Xenophilus arseniciresistens TaxID=1283306 RepID=A0AAE3T1W0_9BURK|nr:helix-turn-helix domain-containing protein [Xenophilus arseniciresistens]MDA7419030.1 helix-turn-helix domain-containing protein [Xenophilus arseniciresistens]
MDSLINAAARALAQGDALEALKQVALRGDPPALALRGIALAQLGEHARARMLLRRAERGFGAHEAVARARCVVAQAEVALALRDLQAAPPALARAAQTLQARGDMANAWHAHAIEARHLLLLGRLDEAQAALARLNGQALPPVLGALAELTAAELALRALNVEEAAAALARALRAAQKAQVPALLAEVLDAQALLQRPAARCLGPDGESPLRLDEVAALLAGPALVVDACRHRLCARGRALDLSRRPVLFALLRALARAWPHDVPREALIAEVFRQRESDETHRARLRVEMGRLRRLVAPLAQVRATDRGYALQALHAPPGQADTVRLLLPPLDGDSGALLALLADGAAWSTSALAQALGESQRQVQRALAELHAEGRVRAVGLARARRWVAPPLTGFTTLLLLPGAPPIA